MADSLFKTLMEKKPGNFSEQVHNQISLFTPGIHCMVRSTREFRLLAFMWFISSCHILTSMEHWD